MILSSAAVKEHTHLWLLETVSFQNGLPAAQDIILLWEILIMTAILMLQLPTGTKAKYLFT
ncbi:hypothetical protein DSECCO2_647920 [anaerobic digester metagenome]